MTVSPTAANGHSSSTRKVGSHRPQTESTSHGTATSTRIANNRVLPFVLPIGLLLVWQALASLNRLPHNVLPAPIEVLSAARELSRTGELWRDLGVSSARAAVGLAAGGSLGFLLGLLNGATHVADRLLDPTVQMLRTIPNLALIPLVILWLGIGEAAKVFLIATGVFFPIYLNTYQGVRNVDADLLEMAKSYGLRSGALFCTVLLPGSLPSVLTGLRFALGSMWLTLIAAETLAADSGIGYMTTTAREFMQTDRILVGVLLYASLGIAADQLSRLLERRLLPWRQRYLAPAKTRL